MPKHKKRTNREDSLRSKSDDKKSTLPQGPFIWDYDLTKTHVLEASLRPSLEPFKAEFVWARHRFTKEWRIFYNSTLRPERVDLKRWERSDFSDAEVHAINLYRKWYKNIWRWHHLKMNAIHPDDFVIRHRNRYADIELLRCGSQVWLREQNSHYEPVPCSEMFGEPMDAIVLSMAEGTLLADSDLYAWKDVFFASPDLKCYEEPIRATEFQ